MTHTPGPWEVVDIEASGFDVIHRFTDYRGNPAEQKIAGVYGENPDEERANAALIAGAPIMLKALREIADLCGDKSTAIALRHKDAGKIARAALAKARGDQAEETARTRLIRDCHDTSDVII